MVKTFVRNVGISCYYLDYKSSKISYHNNITNFRQYSLFHYKQMPFQT